MIPGFEAIVEERIKKARKKGEFDNLDGLHKPLKFEDENVPEELRLAHKILKNSGFLPPEVDLRNKISRTETLLETVDYGDPERTRLQKKLNYYMSKLDTFGGAGGEKSMLPHLYREKILHKLS